MPDLLGLLWIASGIGLVLAAGLVAIAYSFRHDHGTTQPEDQETP